MNRKHYPIYAVAVAAAVLGAVWAGVPASTLLLLALLVACPLMMIFMHGGHGVGGGHAGHGARPADRDSHAAHRHDPAADQARPGPSQPIIRR